MSTTAPKLRNIGPKSAAWLRQVGLRSLEDVAAIGAVDAFMKVRRAGFKPSLNLLYSLEGALNDCHWQEVPESRRTELVQAAEAAIALLRITLALLMLLHGWAKIRHGIGGTCRGNLTQGVVALHRGYKF